MRTEDKSGKEKTGTSAGKREEEITNLGKLKISSFLLNGLKLCENYKSRNGPNLCSTPVKGNPFFLTCYTQLSARKIAAVFWECQHFSDSVNTMYLSGKNHHNYVDNQRVFGDHVRVSKDEGFDQIHDVKLGVHAQRNVTRDHHPESAASLRGRIAASPMRHQQSAERNKHALRPLSPESYGSSLEMAPYNHVATPDSSAQLGGRTGESSYRFKTSTELLKVLNRIWSLEEQHTSNMSLVKGLKTELHHSRSRIKELLKDKQANQREIDRLMKKISGDERIDVALQSARDELEDERKLRKRSESLHRKLARELFAVKVDLATSVKELEKEKKSSKVMEELCDEFAKEIIKYVRQVQTHKQKPDRGWTPMTDHDNLILHISESWLDERAQMKDLETQGITSRRQPVVDKLRHEIETFLSTRQLVDLKETRLRRCSLESIPEAVTGPQDSAFSDLHGEEVSKAGPSNYEEHQELVSRARRQSQGHSPPNVQMFDPQNTPHRIDHGIMKTSGDTSTEINMLQKSDIYDCVKDQRQKGYDEEGHGSNSKPVDKSISELLLSEGRSLTPECKYKEVGSSNNGIRRNASPVRQWMTSMASPDLRVPKVSSKVMSVTDNTLKARLQEPKLKGQRSRLKILKGLS